MNITEYIYLINKPDAVNEKQTVVLEKIVQEFPYFQSARALYLKGLYNQNSFKYNYVLKVAAAHTTDRSILFDFITSDTFTSVNKHLLEQKLSEISAITVKESEVVAPTPEEVELNAAKLGARENTIEQSILSSIREAGQQEPFDIPAEVNWIPVENEIDEPVPTIADNEILSESTSEITATEAIVSDTIEVEQAETTEHIAQPEVEQATESLEIGKPLEFTKGETHSFQEWLQLSKFKPIDRSENKSEPEQAHQQTADEITSESDPDKQKKKELIDRFIETSPKIPPVKHDAPLTPSILVEPSMVDNSYLMTETLARVYLEQKKYHKAIQAYEILILKYPEKSSFFADRILDIKNLQQNNK